MHHTPDHDHRSRRSPVPLFGLAVATLVLMAGCGGSGVRENTDGNGDPSPVGGGSPGTADVDRSLRSLGVNVDPRPRVDPLGEDLPDDYSPLGSVATVARTLELLVVGPQLELETPAGGTEALDNRVAFLELADDDTGIVGPTLTATLPTGTLWELDNTSMHPGMNGNPPGAESIRSIAAADIDGDGVDEIAVVYIDPQSPARTGRVFLDILDDAEDGSAEVTLLDLTGFDDLRDIQVVGGDVDGDGDDELIVGLCSRFQVEMRIFERDGRGDFVTYDGGSRTFVPLLDDANLSLEFATGNIDFDNGEEIAVVLNESTTTHLARYWIIDDARRDFAVLENARGVQGFDGALYQAIVADVAVGDIDADGRAEIILGGLTEFHNDACRSYGHILIALDDAAAGDGALRTLGDHFFDEPYVEPGTGCNSNSHQIRVRKLFINTFDVDGDGIQEIQANRHVYEDFAGAAPWTAAGPEDQPWELPYGEVLSQSNVGGTWSDASVQMVVGDVTGDGRDDIIHFAQWLSEIHVWGLLGPAVDTATWSRQVSIPTTFTNGQARVFPLLVPGNFDKDGLALQYSEGAHYFVFTEPILIAALAAAPCADGIGQNTAACVTAFGQADSQTGGIDGTVTVSASTFVEAEAEFFGFGAAASSRVTASASFSAARAYTLEETVEFTTGPLEDTVVFTTIPLDQYVYTVLSHPDPGRVGETVVINMPRKPVTLQVERSFYNDHLVEGGFPVEGNVFLHTPGNLDSYPTEADADALIDTGGLGHLGPLGELVDAAGEALGPIAERLLGNGLKSSRVSTVGQGSGQTSTEIRFSEQTDYRAGAEVSYEEEVKVTAGGVSVGTTIGGSIDAGISWGTGSTTVYRGTVGSIGAEQFSDNIYNFGLFTYIYNYGNRAAPQFEVINYWVER